LFFFFLPYTAFIAALAAILFSDAVRNSLWRSLI
jgi:hypothetical protein